MSGFGPGVRCRPPPRRHVRPSLAVHRVWLRVRSALPSPSSSRHARPPRRRPRCGFMSDVRAVVVILFSVASMTIDRPSLPVRGRAPLPRHASCSRPQAAGTNSSLPFISCSIASRIARRSAAVTASCSKPTILPAGDTNSISSLSLFHGQIEGCDPVNVRGLLSCRHTDQHQQGGRDRQGSTDHASSSEWAQSPRRCAAQAVVADRGRRFRTDEPPRASLRAHPTRREHHATPWRPAGSPACRWHPGPAPVASRCSAATQAERHDSRHGRTRHSRPRWKISSPISVRGKVVPSTRLRGRMAQCRAHSDDPTAPTTSAPSMQGMGTWISAKKCGSLRVLQEKSSDVGGMARASGPAEFLASRPDVSGDETPVLRASLDGYL